MYNAIEEFYGGDIIFNLNNTNLDNIIKKEAEILDILKIAEEFRDVNKLIYLGSGDLYYFKLGVTKVYEKEISVLDLIKEKFFKSNANKYYTEIIISSHLNEEERIKSVLVHEITHYIRLSEYLKNEFKDNNLLKKPYKMFVEEFDAYSAERIYKMFYFNYERKKGRRDEFKNFINHMDRAYYIYSIDALSKLLSDLMVYKNNNQFKKVEKREFFKNFRNSYSFILRESLIKTLEKYENLKNLIEKFCKVDYIKVINELKEKL